MIERSQCRGTGRGYRLCGGAAAVVAALLIVAHSPPAFAQRDLQVVPRGTADPLTCGSTAVHELEAGGAELFQFSLEEGEAFVIDGVEVTNSIGGLRLRLTDPDGTIIGNTCTGRLQQRASISGVYTLQVKDCIGADAGSYALSLSVVSDTAHTCGVPVACGVNAEGELEVPGQVESYSFYGASGDPVSLDVESTLDRRGGLEIRIFDPTGVAVLHTCGESFDFNLPATGRYTLLVNACLGRNVGEYALDWRSRSCPTHVGTHSGGGAIGIRLVNGGTQVAQIAASNISCGYGASPGYVLELNPPLTINGNRFSTIANPQDSVGNAARSVELDGVVVDDDGTQLIGGMSVRFNHSRCTFQWAATSERDLDWDGWSDDFEEEAGSRPADAESVPEDRRLPTTGLFGPGLCRDRYDNDGDGAADAADSRCVGPLPAAPSGFHSFAGRHAGGGAFAIERSDDGTQVERVVISSIACGALESRSATLNVQIPIVNNRFLAENLEASGSNQVGGFAAKIDGVFFDGDGDGTREQALGAIVIQAGVECRYKWWATVHVDSDGDGWGDVAERRFASDEKPWPAGDGPNSTPEDESVPVSTLDDVGPCQDGADNDGNGLIDGEDPKCPPPTATPTRTPTRTPIPTNTPTRTATSVVSPTSPPTGTATATVPIPPTPTLALGTPTNTAVPATSTRTPTTPVAFPTDTPVAFPTDTPIRPTSTSTVPPATSTEAPVPTSTPTGSVCPGDCDGDDTVTVDEVLRHVGISLGTLDVDACPVADADGNGAVTVDEILTAVNAALSGCP